MWGIGSESEIEQVLTLLERKKRSAKRKQIEETRTKATYPLKCITMGSHQSPTARNISSFKFNQQSTYPLKFPQSWGAQSTEQNILQTPVSHCLLSTYKLLTWKLNRILLVKHRFFCMRMLITNGVKIDKVHKHVKAPLSVSIIWTLRDVRHPYRESQTPSSCYSTWLDYREPRT